MTGVTRSPHLPGGRRHLRALPAVAVALATFAACGDDGATDGAGGSAGAAPTTSTDGAGGAGGGDAFDWGLPPGFPRPRVPEDNPMTAEKVELGRHLFHDVRLSGNETQSCASCHDQALAFTDGRALAVGSTGDVHPRSSMSIVNAGYVNALTWANPVLAGLEEQALVPMYGEDPVELGLAGLDAELIARLEAEPRYAALFTAAFPDDPAPIAVPRIVQALAAFQRSVVSYRTPFDRYTYGGQASALTEAQLRGRELFFGERLECFHCHGGFNFSDATSTEGSTFEERFFHNTGLYNLGGTGDYPEGNRGLYETTGVATDMGRFRAPSLRNVALTAPYMHDGSIATLSEVLDHYAAGGRTIEAGPHAGVGSENPYKSELIAGFELTDQERADMLAFLEALTDVELTTDPRWSDPWAGEAERAD